MSFSDQVIPEEILEQAASWVAKRDRGLTAEEQDEYMQWRQADPRHSLALARNAAVLQRMMQLYEWQPMHTSESNPDLFAAVKRRDWLRPLLAAASIAVTLGLVWHVSRPGEIVRVAETENRYLQVNERLALPDGSRVELKDGSKVQVQYSQTERRVRLLSGEAHFSVWKDASRPFVVEAGDISVVAVGTAFNVRRDDLRLEVLVTSGRVRVDAVDAEGKAPEIEAGQRVVLEPDFTDNRPLLRSVIASVTVEEIAQALSWQTPHLHFQETPLSEVIAQFNALNRHQLVLGDAGLGELRVGGTFRPDNLDAFVRLMQISFDIQAESRGHDETVLRRRR